MLTFPSAAGTRKIAPMRNAPLTQRVWSANQSSEQIRA